MTTQTITVDYAGPGKKNPQYGRVKSGENWFDCSLEIATQLYKHKGRQVQVLVEKTPKGYFHITGFPTAAQMGGQQFEMDKREQGAARIQVNVPQPAISREAGMFAMAVIGKALSGLGQNIPPRVVLTNMIINAVEAWEAAEDQRKNATMSEDQDERIPF